jgi:alpha-glucosidase (family GH31 glycosyl hydrolase)
VRRVALLFLALVPVAPAHAATIDAGALRATVATNPWHLTFAGPAPQASLDEARGLSLGFRDAAGWWRATKVLTERRDGAAWIGTVATSDPQGRTLSVRIAPDGAGEVTVQASADGATAMGIGFDAPPGERHLGFGERSNAVDQRGGDVENYVAEGPYREVERPAIAAFVPAPGYHPRDDATYFPIPWLLSSRGVGVLVENDETSTFHLGTDRADAWSAEVEAPRIALRVIAGPRPADVLRRFSARVGRQPPAAAPFYFGPWWQPKGDERSNVDTLRAAGAIGSVVQTYTHYLPCADQVAEREREKTARFHAAGLAVTTYFNPMLCTDHPRYREAADKGVLTKDSLGRPYEYRYTGSAQFFVGQLDPTHPGAAAFYGSLLDEAVRDGYDGWMEDFGEYTPLDARGQDGSTGSAGHNRYVAGYHAAARSYARSQPKPLARFNRSGWTGAAKESQIVWGGDPSTAWDFDGLQSAVRNGLTMGLSGVSLWGSDIGGFFALSEPQTTPELLVRWLQVGFASGVMRTQANGFQLASSPRAQIFDKDVLPVWTRYARLRTQLYPYLSAAEAEYDRSGLPLMRHLALAFPDDARATARDDEYLLGDDLLAAPVMEPGKRRRTAYLPAGRWVDWWRSVTLDGAGAPHLAGARMLDGSRDEELDAPLDELPLLVRAGAVLPLLDPSVETLTDYGEGKAIRLRDRANLMRLLAWPRGWNRTQLSGDSGDSAVSAEARRGWILKLRGSRTRTYTVEADLSTLVRGAFRPCRVLGVKRGKWSYDPATKVLRLKVRARNARVQALRRC